MNSLRDQTNIVGWVWKEKKNQRQQVIQVGNNLFCAPWPSSKLMFLLLFPFSGIFQSHFFFLHLFTCVCYRWRHLGWIHMTLVAPLEYAANDSDIVRARNDTYRIGYMRYVSLVTSTENWQSSEWDEHDMKMVDLQWPLRAAFDQRDDLFCHNRAPHTAAKLGKQTCSNHVIKACLFASVKLQTGWTSVKRDFFVFSFFLKWPQVDFCCLVRSARFILS